MNYKLIVSKDAHKDIKDIVDYILNKLKSSQAVAGFLNNVEESYKRLVDNPHIYSLCNDERLGRLGYRKVVIKNYLVFYRVDEKNKVVYIVRIIYGGRNYPEIL